jgi:phospholipid/cholesterol/gamma-HCH transport system ATP-binding protein
MAKAIHDLITSMQRKFGFTAVMVSHEIPEIFGISDYVAILKGGIVGAMADPLAFQRTTDPEIREFISVGGTVPLAAAPSGS